MKVSDFFKRYFLTFAFTGFVFGLLYQHFSVLHSYIYIVVLFLAVSLGIYCFRKILSIKSLVFLFIVGAMFFALAPMRYESILPNDSKIITDRIGENIKIKAEVVNFPRYAESGQRAYIKSGKHKILAFLPLYPEVFYGDKIISTGKIEKPESFETDTGRVFDYEGYLAKDGVGFVMRVNKIEKISIDNGNFLVKELFKFKKSWLSKINEILSGEDGALLSGILLGQKALDKDTEESFRIVGLSHIIVLSGYNIAVVIFAIKGLLMGFGKKKKILISAIFAILFTIMVASGASTLRATLMALSAMFADMFSRKISPQRALFVAVFFMTLHNPLILFYDPGFILSFLATFGIIHFSKPIGDKLSYLKKSKTFKEILSTSFSAQIFVLPYIIYLSGEVPVFSPITNILVLPILPMLMFVGAVAVSVSFISNILAFPFIVVSKIFLLYVLKIASVFSNLSISTLQVSSISPVFIFVIYTFAIGGTIFWYQKKAKEKSLALFGAYSGFSEIFTSNSQNF